MMAGSIWMIRSMNEDIDLDEFYSNDPTKFSLKGFHGGEFTEYPGRSYEHEKINIIDNADIEDFGMDVLEEMVKAIGYPYDMIPYMSLDLGLKPLAEDVDFERIFEYVKSDEFTHIKTQEYFKEHTYTTNEPSSRVRSCPSRCIHVGAPHCNVDLVKDFEVDEEEDCEMVSAVASSPYVLTADHPLTGAPPSPALLTAAPPLAGVPHRRSSPHHPLSRWSSSWILNLRA
ncbi:hypothetical protein R6Q57_005459 [Mikania cordata]